MTTNFVVFKKIEPQPLSDGCGGWAWPIPAHAQREGCSDMAVTASREWWNYLPPSCCPLGNVGYVFPIGNVAFKLSRITAQMVDDVWLWVVTCEEVA